MMSKKRKIADCCNNAITNKKIKRQDQGDHDLQNQNALSAGTYTCNTSQLPDNVVSQILQLLPTKLAVRASILSKKWASVWSLIPDLYLDEYDEQPRHTWYTREYRKMFLKFLQRCLKQRQQDKYAPLDKLKLCMRYGGASKIIDKWLTFAVARNVKELDIILRRKHGAKYAIYNLSPTIFLNAKSLATLNLENVKINVNKISPISLPSLKTLLLTDVVFSDLGFASLISGCPSIEHLSLTLCGLSGVKISSSSLKSLEVIRCGNVRIQVEAMNLESFKFCGDLSCPMSMSNINIASCRTLRNLKFFETIFEGPWFEDGLNSRFPLLESLVLDNCVNWSPSHQINIDNQQLKRFVFCSRNYHILQVKLDTPNLLSFELSTGYLSSTQFSVFASNFSINAPNLLEATFNFNFHSVGEFSSLLVKFLGSFDCCKKISLSAKDAKTLIFSEETRTTCCPPLPNLKHLEVETISSAVVKDDVLGYSLEWMAPTLESLHITICQ